MFDFSVVTKWFDDLLTVTCGLPVWLSTTIECVLIAVILLALYSVFAMIYIMYERWVCAWIQCRRGPIRVGPWGSLQIFADVIKILTKEVISLWDNDKFLFFLAPYFVIIASMTTFACLPWGNGLQIIDMNIGVFFIIAMSSLGVIGILLAGWSSNSKYTLIGAMRSGAQMVSYELSVGISMLTVVCLAGTMSITGICQAQEHGWFILPATSQPSSLSSSTSLQPTPKTTVAPSTFLRPSTSSPPATTLSIRVYTTACSTWPSTSTSSR